MECRKYNLHCVSSFEKLDSLILYSTNENKEELCQTSTLDDNISNKLNDPVIITKSIKVKKKKLSFMEQYTNISSCNKTDEEALSDQRKKLEKQLIKIELDKVDMI
jgi:hypothetical protein